MFGFRPIAIVAALFANALTLSAAYAKPQLQSAALVRPTPATTAFIYVDYVTGLDNLMTTVPGKQYRNNIAAFAKMAPLFKVDVALMGEESEYYGTFLPEIKALFAQGAKAFPRTTPTGYTKELAAWLKKTGKRNVVIGGISIDNCFQHQQQAGRGCSGDAVDPSGGRASWLAQYSHRTGWRFRGSLRQGYDGHHSKALACIDRWCRSRHDARRARHAIAEELIAWHGSGGRSISIAALAQA
jgi:hypothetical protein